jgi:hypothetical protein
MNFFRFVCLLLGCWVSVAASAKAEEKSGVDVAIRAFSGHRPLWEMLLRHQAQDRCELVGVPLGPEAVAPQKTFLEKDECRDLLRLAKTAKGQKETGRVSDEPEYRIRVGDSGTWGTVRLVAPETCALEPTGETRCKPNVLSPAQRILIAFRARAQKMGLPQGPHP